MTEAHGSAVEHRVFGPPGTGKTTFLTQQVRRWAPEVGSDALIAVSFTRAAAAELSSRDLPLPPKNVGTLHSFAYRALGGAIDIAETHVRDFNEAHPAFALSTDERPDIDEPVVDWSQRTEGDRLSAHREILRAQRTDQQWWPTSVVSFDLAWNAWKDEYGYLDFTDLIEHALLDTYTAPNDPAVGFFDEVQDFTPLELALVRHWSSRMERLVLAGDDDQCIYAFKGATPDAFLDPPIPDDRKRVLSQSFRLPRAVHAVAAQWVQQLSRREPKHYQPRDDDGVVRTFDTVTYKVPDLMVDEIAARLDDTDDTIMVLTTCSFMLERTKALLKHEAIPFHNPYRRKRGDWNPLAYGSSRRRTAVQRLLAYLRTQGDVWSDDARWWWGDDLRSWVEPLRAKDLLARGAKTRIENMPGAEEVDTDVFDALWKDDATLLDVMQRAVTGDLAWFREHLLSTHASKYEFPLHVAEVRGGASLRQPPRVVIGTVHSVKGAQADVVYLFPDLPVPAVQALNSGRVEDRDAIIRQFYVGMTRAVSELVVCNCASPFSLDPYSLLRGSLL